MKDKIVNNFLKRLLDNYFLFSPQKEGENSVIRELKSINDVDWSGQMPVNTWKDLFLPASEKLFDLSGQRTSASPSQNPPIVCFGMNVLDLKALTLFDQVFSDDVFYQERRKNVIVVGFSGGLPDDYKKFKVFCDGYKEDMLEHLSFDIFILKRKNGRFNFYSGSRLGQAVLQNLKIDNYEHIEFAGPVREAGPDKKMLNLKEKLEKSVNNKVWDELGKICLACGKCSINCPTCFCFNLKDSISDSSRERHWNSCFFNDFSKVAGGHRDLDTVKKKIFFWYFHKFVRIPHQYGIPGCVSCGRCSQTCPVGIKINKVINSL